MNYIFNILLTLTLATGSVIHGSVVRVPTIDNPCENDPTSTASPQYSPLRDQIENTITAANAANDKCALFQTSLRRVLTATEIQALNSSLENITGIPLGASETTLTAANRVNSFQQDYEDVSIYIRHLEFLRSAQIAYDRSMFVEDIDTVNDHFYIWLCKTRNILMNENNPVTEFVNSSVVSENVQNYVLTSKGRYKFNYILMSNAHELIGHKVMKLANYFQTLS